MSNEIKKLIIIGSGPAGLTAAIYSARANLNPLIIEGANPGGQLVGTSIVENWPGEKKIMGPKLMMNLKEHAASLGTTFLSESVVKVDFNKKPFTLWTDQNKALKADSIIIATGATAKRLGVPGEDTYWGKGVTTCAVCDGAFFKDKKVVVIGGGDTAMEDASFLKKFTKQITVIQLLDKLTASPAMQQRVIHDPDITILYHSTITEFQGDTNRLTKITVTNQKTKQQTTMDVDGAFLAIGMKPNTKPFQGYVEMDTWGYLSVKNHTKTSVDGIFAAGDVADFRYRQAISAAGFGCMAALDAQNYLEQTSQKG